MQTNLKIQFYELIRLLCEEERGEQGDLGVQKCLQDREACEPAVRAVEKIEVGHSVKAKKKLFKTFISVDRHSTSYVPL